MGRRRRRGLRAQARARGGVGGVVEAHSALSCASPAVTHVGGDSTHLHRGRHLSRERLDVASLSRTSEEGVREGA
jgi:hypothetical protein